MSHDEPELAIDVNGLGKRFGIRWVLRGVSFDVRCGEAVALLGPNGSGKSTVLRILATLLNPNAGTASVTGLDIVREASRIRGLRAELGLPRVPDLDSLTEDPATATRLREIYGTDPDGRDRIDDVDLLIGTLREGHRPEGFGFGETLFQVFILNASWRLLGDRFYTDDYCPEVYTNEGLEWIDRSTFKDVLLRHYPELEHTGLANVRNGFEPWDEGRLDPARHPTRVFDDALAKDPWAGERALVR